MCSTLPARRVDLRRFTRVVGRMYLLCWNASRVLHRTWMGTSRRRVCWFPSGRHGCAVTEAAVPRYTRMSVSRASRAADLSSYQTLYRWCRIAIGCDVFTLHVSRDYVSVLCTFKMTTGITSETECQSAMAPACRAPLARDYVLEVTRPL